MPNEDFHNDLFGHLQELIQVDTISKVDDYLFANGTLRDKQWQRDDSNGKTYSIENRTIQYFIRNKIHHSENIKMQNSHFNFNELNESIEKMINLINVIHLQEQQQPQSIAVAVATA